MVLLRAYWFDVLSIWLGYLLMLYFHSFTFTTKLFFHVVAVTVVLLDPVIKTLIPLFLFLFFYSHQEAFDSILITVVV